MRSPRTSMRSARISRSLCSTASRRTPASTRAPPRYLASIRAQGEAKSIDKALLKRVCTQTGVEVAESNGKVSITAGHEMGFLEVLDRRRYEVSLIKEKPERYRAASRRQIKEG